MIRSDVSNATIPEEYIKSVTDGIRLALDDPPMVAYCWRFIGSERIKRPGVQDGWHLLRQGCYKKSGTYGP
jgi:hypothetical protein